MVSLRFHTFGSSVKCRSLEVFAKNQDIEEEDFESDFERDFETNLICIKIYHNNNGDYEWVNLDKSTAIKFSKELRKQIALLD